MGNTANIMRVDMTQAGFNYNRNQELVPDNALIDLSTNFNLHNLGVEKRGGTSIIQAASVAQRIVGGYDFRLSDGRQFMIYAKNNGSVYRDADSNVIASGMAVSNFFHFSQLFDTLYFADGSSTPKYWTGSGTATNVTAATDWGVTGYPFQIIYHARGANARMWAITAAGVYASKNNDGTDFSDADVRFIPVYSKGGLKGGFEFGQELFVYSSTETFRIDDAATDVTGWGYTKAIWEGGGAHWRLAIQADNDIYLMAEDLTIYSLQGVFQTGDYKKSAITRPAQIDRYLREQANFANIESWHASYDPKLRCIKWFIQVGGTGTNTGLCQFIDRPADKMWSIHDNNTYSSGYGASCSFTARKSASDWRVRTGDYIGNIWELEQATRNDDGNPIISILKWKPWEYQNPTMHKFFPKGVLRVRSNTNMTFSLFISINNVPLPDQSITVASSGGTFDTALFDSAFFAADIVSKTPFDIKSYGETLQMQLTHSALNEDFFLAEILMAYKELGIRVYAQ